MRYNLGKSLRQWTFVVLGLLLIIPSVYFITQISTGELLIMKTGSMEPTINYGDSVRIDKKVTGIDIHADYKDTELPGDIIAFNRGDDIIITRAVEKMLINSGKYEFKTWGDANAWPDSAEVHEGNILGKVVEITPSFGVNAFIFWIVLLAIGVILIIIGLLLTAHKKTK